MDLAPIINDLLLLVLDGVLAVATDLFNSILTQVLGIFGLTTIE